MKKRAVVFSPEARDDLLALYDWIAERGGARVAMSYIDRLEAYCLSFDYRPSAVPVVMTFATVCASSGSSGASPSLSRLASTT